MAHIKAQIIRYTRPEPSIYFCGIRYLDPVPMVSGMMFSRNIFLFSGIANAELLEDHVSTTYNLLGHKKYPDHYSFSKDDLDTITGAFNEIDVESKCLVTTEKDMMRLLDDEEKAGFLKSFPVFYLPIELYFLRNGDSFAGLVGDLLKQWKVKGENN
jgi:tetraacyldisaccharide 4'-kinase